MFCVGTAKLAVRGHVWMEAALVFTRRGVICKGASHMAGGLNVIGCKRQEEALDGLVANVGFNQLTFEEQPYNLAEKAYNKLQTPWRLSRPSKSNTKLLDNWSRITKQTIYYQLNQTFPRAHNARKPIPGLTKCPTRPHQAGATPLEPHKEARMPRTLPGQGEFSTRHTQYKLHYKPIMKYYKPASNAGNLRANSQSSTRTGHVTKSTTHSSPNVDRRDSPFTRQALAQHIPS